MNFKLNRQKTDLFFKLSLWLKSVFAGLEILGGLVALFISQTALTNLAITITQDELGEDKNDFLANYLLNSAHNLDLSTQHFVALYLLSHGLVKLFLIIGLLKNKLWSYPVSLIIFSLLTLYQFYRFYFTHSLWLLLISAIDIIVIWLIVREYQYHKK